MHAWFDRFARVTADAMGASWAFLSSVAICVVWFLAGPFFGWSDTWQLFMNTFTTIVTFWMVFIIQNTQNRDMCRLEERLKDLERHLPGADPDHVQDVRQ